MGKHTQRCGGTAAATAAAPTCLLCPPLLLQLGGKRCLLYVPPPHGCSHRHADLHVDGDCHHWLVRDSWAGGTKRWHNGCRRCCCYDAAAPEQGRQGGGALHQPGPLAGLPLQVQDLVIHLRSPRHVRSRAGLSSGFLVPGIAYLDLQQWALLCEGRRQSIGHAPQSTCVCAPPTYAPHRLFPPRHPWDPLPTCMLLLSTLPGGRTHPPAA